MAKVAAPSCARVRREGGPSTAMRVSSRLLLIAAIALLTGCGSNGGGGTPQTRRTTGAVAPTPCIANSPAAHRTVGAAQALTTIPIQVLTGVPASSGVMDVGSASCIDVGVSQRVAVTVHARIPPLPAEPSAFPRLLSAILVSPAVQPGAGTAQAATYTLTFTAQSAGSTSISYLAAACRLPPGVC